MGRPPTFAPRPMKIALLVALALPAPALAQSIYVDFGDAVIGAPSAAYGAAAGGPGTWNLVDPNGNQGPFTLVDAGGAPVPATLTIPVGGLIRATNGCTTGDDGLLLDDFMDPLPGGTFTFEGLANGAYLVVCYCFAADDFQYTTDVEVVGSFEGFQTVGGVDWCTTMAHGQLATYCQHTVNVTNGRLEIIYDAGLTPFESFNGIQLLTGTGPVNPGVNYCTAAANSAGLFGRMSAMGVATVASNDLTLVASDLPPGQFGIFITSKTQGFVPGAGGTSNGDLCLGGQIGRLVGPGQILNSGAGGAFSLHLDLGALPQGAGTVAVQPGETWYFQAWHRDAIGLGSNFTDGLAVDFL